MRHRQGQVGGLSRRHAAQDDRHRPGSRLVIGDIAAGIAIDKVFNLSRVSSPPSRFLMMISTARINQPCSPEELVGSWDARGQLLTHAE